MRTINKLGIALVFIIIIITACNQSKKEKGTTSEDVNQKANELMDTTKDYLTEEYAEFEKKLDIYVQNNEKEMAEIKKRSADLTDQAKRKFEEEFSNLELQKKELNIKRKEFEIAANDKRAKLKLEIENLRNALDKSIETFKEERKK
jgi:pyruvate/2-oxoacid:ferredoxin oxidoreductase beta subunit